jgi:hypothetical protein
VEKSFWQSPFLNESSVKEQLILGLEQARDTVLPDVLLAAVQPVEDEVPRSSDTFSCRASNSSCSVRDIKRAVTLALARRVALSTRWKNLLPAGLLQCTWGNGY